jgi:hypothetical protein
VVAIFKDEKVGSTPLQRLADWETSAIDPTAVLLTATEAHGGGPLARLANGLSDHLPHAAPCVLAESRPAKRAISG